MSPSPHLRSSELDPRVGVGLGGLAAILLPALLVPLRGDLSSSNLALLLVLPVMLGAVTGGRLGGAISAVIATMSFDFFLTRPYLSLTIDSRDDIETAILFLLVALIVGTVAAGAYRNSYKAEEGRVELGAIHRVAQKVAAGASAADAIEVGRRELIRMLHLDACEFDDSTQPSSLPVLQQSGAIHGAQYRYVRGGFTLPSGVELPVVGRGEPRGHFVLHGQPGVPVSVDARIGAVVIADQVGAALAAARRSRREEQA